MNFVVLVKFASSYLFVNLQEVNLQEVGAQLILLHLRGAQMTLAAFQEQFWPWPTSFYIN